MTPSPMRLELPTDDGEEIRIMFSYNGETAWSIVIENPAKTNDDPQQNIVSRMRVAGWPINGGHVPEVIIELPQQGRA